MIITKATVFFTALAVSTFSAISAQTSSTPVDDLVVEIDTAIPKTTKMPKNKKGKKGGKAVHTKSGKKGKKFTSPNSSSTTTAPSSSPTGVCETRFISRQALEIERSEKNLADYFESISEDPVLSQVPAVGALLDQAASVDAALKSTLFGEATGCDFDASLANSLLDDSLSTRRHLEEEDDEYVCPELVSVNRKLQGDLFAPIIKLAGDIIYLFLSSVLHSDKLNKVYPLYMGLLGEITCSYYALSLAVVDVVKAVTLEFTGTAYDLSSLHENALGCLMIKFEDIGYFPEIFNIPTVFDAAACGL